jgi:hypothetical protein
MEKTNFLKEVEYACQEITNRYFSVEVAQGKFSDEPWWIKKKGLLKQTVGRFGATGKLRSLGRGTSGSSQIVGIPTNKIHSCLSQRSFLSSTDFKH